jgi:uncharacterized damage-inducible protein DinB
MTEMDPIVAVHAHEMEELRRQLVETVTPMTDDQVNASVATFTNTVGIIVRHLAGSEKYWIGEVVGRRPAHRNRDAEFGRDRVTKTDVLRQIEQAGALTKDVLSALAPGDWATEVEISRATGTMRRTKGYAVIHAVAHLSYHLGQLKLFSKALLGK